MHGAEAEILQLGLELVHAQALRNRRVDLQGFQGNATARLRLHGAEGSHVVQTIGQLDQNHAQVACHRQQHLAEALGSGFLATLEVELVEFGNPVNQFKHGAAELVVQAFGGDIGIFEGVMQDRGNDGFDIHAKLGEDAGHRDRMGDVGLAAAPGLALVRQRTDLVGAPHARDLRLRQVAGKLVLQRQHIRGDLVAPGRSRIRSCLHRHLAAAPDQAAAQWPDLPRSIAKLQVVATLRKVVIHFRGRPFQGLAFGALAGLPVDLVDHGQVHLACCDFAQGNHGRLVVVGFNRRISALGELTRALGRHQHQFESVIDDRKAIFYGNTRHLQPAS